MKERSSGNKKRLLTVSIHPRNLQWPVGFKFYGYLANMKACGPTENMLEPSKTEFNIVWVV